MDKQAADNQECHCDGDKQGSLNQPYFFPDCPYPVEEPHEAPSSVDGPRSQKTPARVNVEQAIIMACS
jgi:hypothetical protein